jgi:hypothetical protein
MIGKLAGLLLGKARTGRLVIERITGKLGILAIKALLKCLTKFNRGAEAVGKGIWHRLLRFAWSCYQCSFLATQLESSSYQKLSGQLALLVSNLMDQLHSPVMTRSPVRLVILMTEVYNEAVGLLEGVVSNEALQDLAVVYSALTDLPFVVYFLTSRDTYDERETFTSALGEVLEAYIDVAHSAAKSLRNKLLKRHRALSALLCNSAIDDQFRLIVFLRHKATESAVTSWLQEAFGIEKANDWLAFYASVDSYKQHTGNSAMSSIRATAIIDVFIRSDGSRYLELPEDICSEIEMLSIKNAFSRRLFARAQAFIYSQANKKFAPACFSSKDGIQDFGFTSSSQMRHLQQDLEETSRRLAFFGPVEEKCIKLGRPSLGCLIPASDAAGERDHSQRANDCVQAGDDSDDDVGDVLGDAHGDNAFGGKLGPNRVTFWAK